MTVATRFSEMQAAELEWWQGYLKHPSATVRMFFLYGARYFDFFPELFINNMGAVVEFGSGPLPVFCAIKADRVLAVDPLWQGYVEAGLAIENIPAGEPEDGAFDTALLLNVLDHTDDPEAVVEAAHRALKAGGKAYVFVHLDQTDEKHALVHRQDPDKWFRGWTELRANIQMCSFDPPAFVGVYEKR